MRIGTQHLSYYREMRGSLLLTIGESVTANSDHVSLNNQSHYSLDVIEFYPAFHSEGLVPSKGLPSRVRASKG